MTGAPCARLERDALLCEISQHFAQEDDKGPDINQQLPDIVNKRWSSKLNEVKLKEKLEKYPRPENCERLIVPRVNAEIWEKIDQKARQQDLRACAIQKTTMKVGSILAQSTESLLPMRQNLPELDQLVRMNTYASPLLGHTMYELSLCRRDVIKRHLHKDYASLCASHVPMTTSLFGKDLQLNPCLKQDRPNHCGPIQEIRELLDKGVIVESSYKKGEYISPIFLRSKPDGSHRFILNLKCLNQHVVYRHFNMDSIWTATRLMKLSKLLYGLSRPKRCLLLCAKYHHDIRNILNSSEMELYINLHAFPCFS